MQNFSDIQILYTITDLIDVYKDRIYERDETYSSLFNDALMELE